jgi:tetratricopeptide (TPR) repeat protein
MSMATNGSQIRLTSAQIESLRARARSSLETRGPCAEAAELYEALVKVDPRDGLAWLNLGDSLRSVGRFREAEEALLTARELAPTANKFTVDARLGMVLSKRGSPLEAEKWFRLATSSSDCPGWVWVLRAANLTRRESSKLARECLRAAKLRGDVDLEEVLLNEALIDRALGNYQDAIRNAQAALDIDPDYSPARELLSSIRGAADAREHVDRRLKASDQGD